MVSFKEYKIKKFNNPVKKQAIRLIKRFETKDWARFLITEKDSQYLILKIDPKISKLYEITVKSTTSINNKILKKFQDAMYIYDNKATINCSRVSNASRSLQLRNNWF